MTTQGGFKCPMCGGQFQSQRQLDQHAQQEHKQQK